MSIFNNIRYDWQKNAIRNGERYNINFTSQNNKSKTKKLSKTFKFRLGARGNECLFEP